MSAKIGDIDLIIVSFDIIHERLYCKCRVPYAQQIIPVLASIIEITNN